MLEETRRKEPVMIFSPGVQIITIHIDDEEEIITEALEFERVPILTPGPVRAFFPVDREPP